MLWRRMAVHQTSISSRRSSNINNSMSSREEMGRSREVARGEAAMRQPQHQTGSGRDWGGLQHVLLLGMVGGAARGGTEGDQEEGKG